MMDFLRAVLFLPPGASTIAEEIDVLHIFVISVTMIGAVGVFVVAVWFTFKYKRRHELEYTPRVVAPLWYEVLVIGGLMGLFLLWWVIGTRQYGQLHATPADADEVYVTGKQWMWKFAHPGGRSSVGVMVVPQGRPVRLLITSRDVIHSFYVPAFRIKRDAVPGRYTNIWFQADRRGTFRVMCTEYCGEAHSRMWASVVVLDPEDYEAWLDGAMPDQVAEAQANARAGREVRFGDEGRTSMIALGEQAASRYGCINCHTVDGQEHIGPTWLGLFDSWELLQNGQRVHVDEDYLTESMMEPEARRVAGFETVMPTYKGVLSHVEVAAIVEYIKALESLEQPPAVNLPPVEPRATGTQWQSDDGTARWMAADAGTAREGGSRRSDDDGSSGGARRGTP